MRNKSLSSSKTSWVEVCLNFHDADHIPPKFLANHIFAWRSVKMPITLTLTLTSFVYCCSLTHFTIRASSWFAQFLEWLSLTTLAFVHKVLSLTSGILEDLALNCGTNDNDYITTSSSNNFLILLYSLYQMDCLRISSQAMYLSYQQQWLAKQYVYLHTSGWQLCRSPFTLC